MRRIIAYIYHYKRQGKVFCKCNNTGFCRVEKSNDKCGITLCLKDGCGVEGTAHIYILKKADSVPPVQSVYHRTKLDSCYTMCGGVLSAKLCMDGSDGVCLECGGRIYIALWNECPESVQLVEYKDNLEENIKHKALNKAENVREIKIEDKDRQENRIVNEKISEGCRDLTRVYNRLCKIRIILNGVEYPAVKMKPQEMIMLPRSCWRLANNIFLMESYYRYRHILFLQYEGRYAIAVPWKRYDGCKGNNEIAIRAKQCGFQHCIAGYEYGRARDEKNYWIMYLE